MTTEGPDATAPRSKPRAARSRKPSNGAARGAGRGDIAPSLSETGIEHFEVAQAIESAQAAKASAVTDIIEKAAETGGMEAVARSLEAILAGASPDDVQMLRETVLGETVETPVAERLPVAPDDQLADGWRLGGYPYKNLMSRKNYEKQKYQLQVELLKLQAWVKETGQRVVILFEGRDAAGKGGHDQTLHGTPESSRRAGRGA